MYIYVETAWVTAEQESLRSCEVTQEANMDQERHFFIFDVC
jgi:hypothetical protein